ncbi:uncharacterized protein TrAtP1_007496 [Trichoderma atroviride]|uniref:uncharacterized protein n=1 Tax=Hypocrea atroviridis TaxID=63577 RepID=UPI003320FBD8|nr:hypothetical protein TrAtP1_007496 [Trichoderma atroviride]
MGLADKIEKDKSRERTFLWAYVFFTYFFVALTIYFINKETFRIIGYRQDYLGSQSTLTDRTFRLTGVPPRLQNRSAHQSRHREAAHWHGRDCVNLQKLEGAG